MSDTKFVVFIDALSPRDLKRCDFMPSTQGGEMRSSIPRVTPDVMSTVYTGEDSAENGMGRIHVADDVAEKPPRPEGETILEEAMREGMSVCGLTMPYAGPVEFVENESAIGTTFTGTNHFAPPDAQSTLHVPGPAGDLVKEKNHQTAFDLTVDYTSALFSNARTLSQSHDVVFIGFRNIDSYCHFQYDMGPDGRHTADGERYRDLLAEVVDIQMSQLANLGDVYWFSDHGATEREETFRVNNFLAEEGYLDYEYDKEFIEKAQEQNLLPAPEPEPERRVENQIVAGQPGVTVTEKAALCADPYDSAITVYDDAVTDDIIDQLESTGYYRDVYHKSDLHDEDAEFYDQLPDIIPDRAEGVFVSGNIHEEPIGMGWYRTGVHDMTGVYGSTTGVGGGKTDAAGIHNHLREFIGL